MSNVYGSDVSVVAGASPLILAVGEDKTFTTLGAKVDKRVSSIRHIYKSLYKDQTPEYKAILTFGKMTGLPDYTFDFDKMKQEMKDEAIQDAIKYNQINIPKGQPIIPDLLKNHPIESYKGISNPLLNKLWEQAQKKVNK